MSGKWRSKLLIILPSQVTGNKTDEKTKKEGRLVEALFVALGSNFNFGGF